MGALGRAFRRLGHRFDGERAPALSSHGGTERPIVRNAALACAARIRLPGTIIVRVEWDEVLRRTAVAFAALEREAEGATSPARCSARCERTGS